MGRHYPAMALVEGPGLVDREALVEIEADADDCTMDRRSTSPNVARDPVLLPRSASAFSIAVPAMTG